MSETRDKRRRTDLDLFVLALIDSGVSTPYELQKAAGLSQGATIPALQRLLDARLVRQGKPSARGRTDCQATAVGKRLLKDGWLALTEGVLAVTLIRTFVWRSWHCWEVAIVGCLPTSSVSLPTRRWSWWLQPSQWAIQLASLFSHGGTAICDSSTAKALLTAESTAIRAMADALPWKLSGGSRRSSRGTKKQKGF